MALYGQEPEVRLLCRLISHLEHPILIDVGAERGEVADALLASGITIAHAFEPHPVNAASLRERFAGDERVTVYESAVGDRDGKGELHESVDPEGATLPFGHTLIERPDTEAIGWRGRVPVELRTLGSLVESGELPRRVGILKVDTEGSDLAVLRGMGGLEPDVVMVEHWSELPDGLGACPWSSEEIASEMRGRGFGHFLFLIHRGEFVTFAWDDGEVERGAMGNLVFLHDRVVTRLLPKLVGGLAELAEHAATLGRRNGRAADERLAVIDELAEAAAERLDLIKELDRTAEERLADIARALATADERGRELEAHAARIAELEAELASVRAQTP